MRFISEGKSRKRRKPYGFATTKAFKGCRVSKTSLLHVFVKTNPCPCAKVGLSGLSYIVRLERQITDKSKRIGKAKK